jgi:hypothetical protein
MTTLLSRLLTMTLAIGAVQCQHATARSSALKVVGGEIDLQSFPATVGYTILDVNDDLIAYCTGTFVRDDLLITAGHCATMDDAAKFVVYSKLAPLSQTRPSSIEYSTHPYYNGPEGGGPVPYDLAFIFFPKGTAPSAMISPVTSAVNTPPDVDSVVTMVGYGDATSEWEALSLGERRIGHNKVADNVRVQQLFNMIAVTTASGPTSVSNASINHGDSGGPLYDDKGTLVGTTQSGQLNESAGFWQDRFVDLSSSGIHSYVQAVMTDQSSVTLMSGPMPLQHRTLAPVAKPAADPTAAPNPWACVDNNGKGYGPIQNCEDRRGKCAKKGPDLQVPCRVRPTWYGSHLCIKNGGRGFGGAFNCHGAQCAKSDPGLKVSCVRLDMIRD